jgi:hypothetical protein
LSNEESIAEGVPEVEDTVRLARPESGADDDIGATLHERPDQTEKVLRVVLEVGILNGHEVAAGVLETGPQRSPFSPIVLVPDQPHLGDLLLQRGRNRSAVIGGTIVDDEDLQFQVRPADGEQPVDDRRQSLFLVEARHHYCQDHRPGIGFGCVQVDSMERRIGQHGGRL